jgi:hypothetical protein
MRSLTVEMLLTAWDGCLQHVVAGIGDPGYKNGGLEGAAPWSLLSVDGF